MPLAKPRSARLHRALIRAVTAGSTGAADHPHLVIALPPKLDLPIFVNNLKDLEFSASRKEFAEAGLSQARLLVPVLLPDFVCGHRC